MTIISPGVVESELADTISDENARKADLRLDTEAAADLPLHIPNIPTAYHSDANLVNIVTLKKDYEQGNVQLTVSFLRVDGTAVHLLDCDMDENRNIALHSFDILKHTVTGGTNPISMYDYIVEDSAQQSVSGVSNIDLGYVLA